MSKKELENEPTPEFTDKELQECIDTQKKLDVFLKQNFEVQEEDREQIVVSTGLDLLDAISGGGFGMNLVMLVGQPGSAKSTLAAKVLAEAQRVHKPKFISKYFDSEQSTTKQRLSDLGVNYPPIEPNSQSVTVEKIMKSIDGICKFKDDNPELLPIPSMVVWDSIANTLTEKGFV